MNLVRFGKTVDLEYFKKERDASKLANRQLEKLFYAAALARKFQIVAWAYRSKHYFAIDKYTPDESIYIIFGLLNSLFESEREEILAEYYIFDIFISISEIVDFKYNESTGIHSFYLKLRSSHGYYELASITESFQYDIKINFDHEEYNYRAIIGHIFGKSLFYSSNLTETKVLSYLNILMKLEATRKILMNTSIRAS